MVWMASEQPDRMSVERTIDARVCRVSLAVWRRIAKTCRQAEQYTEWQIAEEGPGVEALTDIISAAESCRHSYGDDSA